MTEDTYNRLNLAVAAGDVKALRLLLATTPRLLVNQARTAIQGIACDGAGVRFSVNVPDWLLG